MDDNTIRFINDIDSLTFDKELKEKNNDYYGIFLCEKIGNNYIQENEGDFNKVIEIFYGIYDNKKNRIFIRTMAFLSICVIKLRVAKTLDDKKLSKHFAEAINRCLTILDKLDNKDKDEDSKEEIV